MVGDVPRASAVIPHLRQAFAISYTDLARAVITFGAPNAQWPYDRVRDLPTLRNLHQMVTSLVAQANQRAERIDALARQWTESQRPAWYLAIFREALEAADRANVALVAHVENAHLAIRTFHRAVAPLDPEFGAIQRGIGQWAESNQKTAALATMASLHAAWARLIAVMETEAAAFAQQQDARRAAPLAGIFARTDQFKDVQDALDAAKRNAEAYAARVLDDQRAKTADLQRAHDAQVEALKAQHRAELQLEKKRHEDALVAEQKRHEFDEARFKAEQKATAQVEQQKYQVALQLEQQKHQVALEAERRKHQDEEDRLRANGGGGKAHQEAAQKYKALLAEDAGRVRHEYTRRLKNALDDNKRHYEAQIKDLQEQLRAGKGQSAQDAEKATREQARSEVGKRLDEWWEFTAQAVAAALAGQKLPWEKLNSATFMRTDPEEAKQPDEPAGPQAMVDDVGPLAAAAEEDAVTEEEVQRLLRLGSIDQLVEAYDKAIGTADEDLKMAEAPEPPQAAPAPPPPGPRPLPQAAAPLPAAPERVAVPLPAPRAPTQADHDPFEPSALTGAGEFERFDASSQELDAALQQLRTEAWRLYEILIGPMAPPEQVGRILAEQGAEVDSKARKLFQAIMDQRQKLAIEWAALKAQLSETQRMAKRTKQDAADAVKRAKEERDTLARALRDATSKWDKVRKQMQKEIAYGAGFDRVIREGLAKATARDFRATDPKDLSGELKEFFEAYTIQDKLVQAETSAIGDLRRALSDLLGDTDWLQADAHNADAVVKRATELAKTAVTLGKGAIQTLITPPKGASKRPAAQGPAAELFPAVAPSKPRSAVPQHLLLGGLRARPFARLMRFCHILAGELVHGELTVIVRQEALVLEEAAAIARDAQLTLEQSQIDHLRRLIETLRVTADDQPAPSTAAAQREVDHRLEAHLKWLIMQIEEQGAPLEQTMHAVLTPTGIAAVTHSWSNLRGSRHSPFSGAALWDLIQDEDGEARTHFASLCAKHIQINQLRSGVFAPSAAAARPGNAAQWLVEGVYKEEHQLLTVLVRDFVRQGAGWRRLHQLRSPLDGVLLH
jgi:hypothetical protein